MNDIPLFQHGLFTLSSGIQTNWRINAELLSDQDIQTCAMLLVQLLPEFGQVEGVPRGGIKLANAFSEYITPGYPTTLIVDDVWTTGGSWYRQCDDRKDVLGAVIFARDYVPPHVVALWHLDNRLSHITQGI